MTEELPPELEAAVDRFLDGFKREYEHLYRESTPAEERKLRKGRENYEQYYRQNRCWDWPHEVS